MISQPGRSRYNAGSSSQTEFQPGSDGQVLYNLKGITCRTEMEQWEFRLLAATKDAYLDVLTQETRITEKLLLEMHLNWLRPLYPWAGKYRTVNLAKNDFKWPPYGFVPNSMREFEQGLLTNYTPCRAADLRVVADQMAQVHAELLIIHPFRDGNGRIARWIAEIMAAQAGLPVPRWPFSSSADTSEIYIRAVQAGYAGVFEPLADFFIAAISSATSE